MSRDLEEYKQIVPSKTSATSALELFAQQLSDAAAGHRFAECALYKLTRGDLDHYLIFKGDPTTTTRGQEVLVEKMQEFAKAEKYFTAGKDTSEYKSRKREWEDLA